MAEMLVDATMQLRRWDKTVWSQQLEELSGI